jgi:c-di-AMP phosphodiesterase-like protein
MKLIFIIIILFLFLIYFIFIKENFEHDTKQNNIEIIVSRYNEDLEWLKDEPFNKYPIIIYNKGNNDNFYKPNNSKIIKLKNIGRCDHTYLYHIINNYDNLSEHTIFLPGSSNMITKYTKAKKQIYEIEKNNNTVIIGYKYNNIKNDLYNFNLDNWVASDIKNKTINNESKLELSQTRPFGLWYKKYFGNLDVKYVSYLGILGIKNIHIIIKKLLLVIYIH